MATQRFDLDSSHRAQKTLGVLGLATLFLASCVQLSMEAPAAVQDGRPSEQKATSRPAASQAPVFVRPKRIHLEKRPPEWAAPRLDRSISIRDGKSDRVLDFKTFIQELTSADVVFLGETHVDETTHRVELGVYEALLASRKQGVALAMEMFERDTQGYLDDYLAGKIEERRFLALARPWGNYRTSYRPLVELAKEKGQPVIASNFPRPIRGLLAMRGASALDKLNAKQKAQIPERFLPNAAEYWKRVDNAVRGHLAMMRRATSRGDRLYATQSLWDNSMGESCAKALDRYPGKLVLHVNGGFHSAYWDGTVRQLRLRKPGAKIKTIAIRPTTNPSVARSEGKPIADYIVYAEARAEDLNDGSWSVQVSRKLKYRFHLPKSANDNNKVPLLIWLSDDGLPARDGLALWRERLGQDVAIAVPEFTYRERRADLGAGGRWFWPDEFPEGIGDTEQAVHRLWAYILRHFPVQKKSVCIAGEGTGATVVAAISLMTESIDHRAIAFSPKQYTKIKDFPLPLPEYRGDLPKRDKELLVLGEADDEAWWLPELKEYAAIGFQSRFEQRTEDAWQRASEQESALRQALGLPVKGAPAGERLHLVLKDPSVQGRHWARLLASRYARVRGAQVAVLDKEPATDESSPVTVGVDPKALSTGIGIPRCPGPFGGTTVLVVLPGSKLSAWLPLEEKDPLHRFSRFHRLRIASTEGEHALARVLDRLMTKNRKNVLIVPATFCADAMAMRKLAKLARAYEDRMTLHWLPGLGGSAKPKR